MRRVILAYTGGLATSLCLHWLRMKKGLEVVTFTANVGQRVNLEPIGERALRLGAASAYIGDLRAEFLRRFAFPALRASAVYDSGYFLGPALTRPLIVREMVKIAEQDRCDLIAHGCTGNRRDCARFEAAAEALAPQLKVIAPLQEWGLTSREQQLRYARRYGMEIDGTEDEAFSAVDQNLWGSVRRHAASASDPWKPVPEDTFLLTARPEKAPSTPEDLRLRFEKGIPVSLDGRSTRAIELVEALNQIGARHGVGRLEVIEDSGSRAKARVVYEAPAAVILFEAFRALECLVLPKDVIELKRALSRRYAALIQDGQWCSELREALEAFFTRVTANVTGEVRIRVHKGRALVRGMRSPHSLLACVRAPKPADDPERGGHLSQEPPPVPDVSESDGAGSHRGGQAQRP